MDPNILYLLILLGCVVAFVIIVIFVLPNWGQQGQQLTQTPIQPTPQPRTIPVNPTVPPAPPSDNPPAPRQLVQHAEEMAIRQTSLLVGIVVSLAVGVVIDYYLGYYVLYILGLGDYMPAHGVLIAAIAALYYIWGLYELEIGWRGVIKLLGARLMQSGDGLGEGWQWVARPIMSIQSVDCREKSERLDDPDGAFSSDGVLIAVRAFFRYRVADPYRYIGVVNAEAALKGLGLQTLRIKIKKHKALWLRNADKAEFSDQVALMLDETLVQNNNPRGIKWGLRSGLIAVEEISPIDKKLIDAWGASVREEAEGAAEKIQIQRRHEQIGILIEDHKIAPALAASLAQIEAEKPGATMHTVNVPGLNEAITKGADAVIAALTSYFSKQGKDT